MKVGYYVEWVSLAGGWNKQYREYHRTFNSARYAAELLARNPSAAQIRIIQVT